MWHRHRYWPWLSGRRRFGFFTHSMNLWARVRRKSHGEQNGKQLILYTIGRTVDCSWARHPYSEYQTLPAAVWLQKVLGEAPSRIALASLALSKGESIETQISCLHQKGRTKDGGESRSFALATRSVSRIHPWEGSCLIWP